MALKLASVSFAARHALRSLASDRRFTLTAVLGLALGVASNVAIFSIVNGVMLNAVPWRNADRVVQISDQKLGESNESHRVTISRFLDWRERIPSLAGVLAAESFPASLIEGDHAEVLYAARVLPAAFDALELRVTLGRPFSDAEPGGAEDPPVILTHGTWQRWFGADRDVLGRRIRLDGSLATVVGVLDAEQWFPSPEVDLLMPLELARSDDPLRDERSLMVFGILAPGVTLARAQDDLDAVNASLSSEYPATDGGWSSRMDAAVDVAAQGSPTALYLLLGAVFLVLVVACLNVVNLILARGRTRSNELAVRSALGATPAQIALELLCECGWIALLALPAAWLFAWLGMQYLLLGIPARIDWLRYVIQFDRSVAIFAVALTVAAIFLFGLAPSLRLARQDLRPQLNEGADRSGAGPRKANARAWLVVLQLAVALPLLVVSALLSRAFVLTSESRLGFEPDNILLSEIPLPDARYPTPTHWREFEEALRLRVGTLPGIIDVATSRSRPIGLRAQWSYRVVGQHDARSEELPMAGLAVVSANYFRTLRLPLLLGRDFSAQDGASSSVVVVNAALARAQFGDGSPLGAQLELSDGSVREIVGVAGDVAQVGFGSGPASRLYLPIGQQPAATFWFMARTRGDPIESTALLRDALAELDPLLVLHGVTTMRAELDLYGWFARFFRSIVSALGVLAVGLALVGVYGLVSYATASRTAEFAIRATVGASPIQIALLVLRQTGRLAGAGVLLGLLAAIGLARLVAGFVHGMASFDLLWFGAISAALLASALAASALPALRASRSDPLKTLRGRQL